eukprot:Opistho-2@48298
MATNAPNALHCAKCGQATCDAETDICRECENDNQKRLERLSSTNEGATTATTVIAVAGLRPPTNITPPANEVGRPDLIQGQVPSTVGPNSAADAPEDEDDKLIERHRNLHNRFSHVSVSVLYPDFYKKVIKMFDDFIKQFPDVLDDMPKKSQNSVVQTLWAMGENEGLNRLCSAFRALTKAEIRTTGERLLRSIINDSPSKLSRSTSFKRNGGSITPVDRPQAVARTPSCGTPQHTSSTLVRTANITPVDRPQYVARTPCRSTPQHTSSTLSRCSSLTTGTSAKTQSAFVRTVSSGARENPYKKSTPFIERLPTTQSKAKTASTAAAASKSASDIGEVRRVVEFELDTLVVLKQAGHSDQETDDEDSEIDDQPMVITLKKRKRNKVVFVFADDASATPAAKKMRVEPHSGNDNEAECPAAIDDRGGHKRKHADSSAVASEEPAHKRPCNHAAVPR